MNREKRRISECLRTLGANITRARLKKGIYLPAFAESVNISVYVLKNIEEGKYPKLKISTIYLLAESLKVEAAELFEGM